MAQIENLFPDVIINKRAAINPNVVVASSNISRCALIGKASRGERNKVIYVTSWREFIELAAKDMDSPFGKDSYLAYAVYGYFQNGGTELYYVNATDGTESKASATVGGVTYTAKEAGDYANDRLFIEHKDAGEESYTVNIYFGDTANEDTLKETFTVKSGSAYDVLKASEYVDVTFAETYTLAVAEATALTGGKNGGSPTDYSETLKLFDTIEDGCLIGIVDDATPETNKLLNEYCTKNDQMVALTGTESETTTADTVLKDYVGSGREQTFFPSWGGVTDSMTGEVVNVPIIGHVAGYIMLSLATNGMSEVPAGTKASLVGIVSLPVNIDKVTGGKLYAKNICCIVDKKDYGICIWGGRTKVGGSDENEGNRFINSLLLETMVYRDLYNGLQPYLFDSNVPETWAEITASVTRYMNGLLNKNALYSKNASESYKVICNATNNDPSSNVVNVTVAYREKGCAEFIYVNLTRTMGSLE